MGCITSKIMTKSASFREEYNRSMRKKTDDIEEIIITKNSSDQFVALLCAANTVARKLKEGSPVEEPNGIKYSSLVNHAHPNPTAAKDPERRDIETIDTWELLEGLEEDNDQLKTCTSNDSITPSRSFRTVEDFDAMMVANQALECLESSIKNDEDIKQEVKESELPKHKNVAVLERNVTNEKGSRRKAMAKELTALNVPGFEFARTGSLREWLSQGGQVFSPGSYITPKFGNFISPEANKGDSSIIFDPELIQQFEQAMEQLTKEEESILKEIVESLEGDNEECISTTETSENSQERPRLAEDS